MTLNEESTSDTYFKNLLQGTLLGWFSVPWRLSVLHGWSSSCLSLFGMLSVICTGHGNAGLHATLLWGGDGGMMLEAGKKKKDKSLKGWKWVVVLKQRTKWSWNGLNFLFLGRYTCLHHDQACLANERPYQGGLSFPAGNDPSQCLGVQCLTFPEIDMDGGIWQEEGKMGFKFWLSRWPCVKLC